MNVLSLFDGMSCAQVALNKSEVEYDKYFASEVDKAVEEFEYHSNTYWCDVCQMQTTIDNYNPYGTCMCS